MVKKGCLFVALGLVLLVAGVGFLYALYMDKQVGVFASQPVSHARYITPSTRVQAVFDMDRLQPLMLRVFPKNLPLPKWLPVGPSALLPYVLPREIAVFGGADYGKGAVDWTLFINERRGGPAIAQILATMKVSSPGLHFNDPVVSMPERGVLESKATLAIPDGLEDMFLQNWTHDLKGAPLTLEGGHDAEFVLDNRTGELFTLTAAYLKANGRNWKTEFAQPNAQIALGVLPMILDLRVSADVKQADRMAVRVRVDGTPEAQMSLNLLAGFLVPNLKKSASENGMTLEGQAEWSDTDSALVGEFTLTGFEPLLARHVGTLLPAGPSS